MKARQLEVDGRAARVHLSSDDGPALVLIHGGWAGAEAHWSRVWDALSERHRVIAPDLPGLGSVERMPLPTVAAYAAWLASLLDVLGIERAHVVGSSFGGSVAWSFAGRFPARCAGASLVNGIPMPATPPLLRRLGTTRGGRALMRLMLRLGSYRAGALRRAFVDPRAVPTALLDARSGWPLIVPRFADLLIAGDGPPDPRLAPLLVWGAGDRLPGTTMADGRALAARLHGARLEPIEGAGHFPSLEQPEAFVRVIDAWTGSPTRAR